MKKVSQFLYGALAIITTALLGTACMDDLSNQFDPMDGVVKIIPYTINATSVDTVTTKVTANIDKKMLFEDNDILIITGDQISGTLSLIEKKGTPRGVKGVFRGTLEWKGSGDTPPDDWDLNARVISENDKLNGLDTFTGAITAETGEAVQKYSLLTGSSTYQAKNFTFSQGTSFIKFTISFEPIPDEGDYTAVVTNENGTTTLATGSVYIDDEGKTEFTLALPGATVLDHAKVTINGIDIKFGGKNQVTLTPGDLYEITRFYSDDLNSPLTFEAAADGVITINIPEEFNAPFTGITYYKNNEAGVLVKGDDPSVAYKTTEIPVVTGDKVTFFGDNDAYNDDKNPITINCSNLCYVYGNVMSLVQSSNFASLTVLPGEETFAGLFSGMKSNNRGDSGSSVIPNHITNHASRKLVLPATRLNVCCYQYMFDHCVDLVKAPELPAQNLPDQCYEGMFASCTALTDVYDLTVENVGESSCMEMFEGCSSLRNAPQITVTGSTRDAEDAFRHMFTDCINLVNVPDIHIPDLSEEASSCFSGMFEGCTSLVVAPQFDLPLTSNLPGGCFKSAFRDCESLTTPPELPFVNLGVACYCDMFAYCTRLSDAPVLPATVLPVESYSYMFYNCSSLKHIKCLAKNISAYICLENWTEGVYPTGTFERDPDMWDWPLNSASGIPSGWTIVPDLPNDRSTPLTLEAAADGTITIANPLGIDNIWYTVNGEAHHPGNVNPIVISNVEAGQKVALYGSNTSYGYIEWRYDAETGKEYSVDIATNIRSTMDCYVYGNVMSLINDTDFATRTAFSSDPDEGNFLGLFDGNTHLKNETHRKLVLPATTLSEGCYMRMFEGCTGLTVAPVLPATEMEQACYQEMFSGCTGLTQAPALPAMTLDKTCYQGMFKGCTSLTAVPELPATNLKKGCYREMFSGCTGLTQLPDYLPAGRYGNGELRSYCYDNMFSGCTSLVSVPASFLPADDLSLNCYSEMFKGCTSLVDAPELPATSLDDDCYNSMFEGCTSLVRAPELPATYFAKYCYAHMFKGCSSLNYIKCQATSQSSSGYGTEGWVEGVAASGTFVTAEGAFFWATGPDGIPTGWTVEGRGESYTIAYQIENCTLSPQPSAVAANSEFSTFLEPDESYRMSDVQVTMGGTDITSTCYDEEKCTITIGSVSSDLTIKAIATYTSTYNITFRPTNATSSNPLTTVGSLASYETIINPVSPAKQLDVTVMMGGKDVTWDSWNNYQPGNTLHIDRVTGDVIITAVGSIGTCSVNLQTDGCYYSNGDYSVPGGSSYDNTFTPWDGYEIYKATVTMDGVDITETAWTASSRTVHIDSVTGDLEICVYAQEKGYSVTQSLEKITSSFKEETIGSGKEFEAWLTPDDDYSINSVSVTMGGTDITGSCYDGYRKIYISSVSGDIKITASATYDPGNNHTITYSYNPANVTIDNTPATLHHLATYSAKVSPVWPANTVSVKILLETTKGWEDFTSQYWNGESIHIPYLTNNMQITATGTTTYYIYKNLTKCWLSNSASSVSGGSYETYVYPDDGWTLESVEVWMGGDNITSTCYKESDHSISISEVKGDITITATATGGSETASVYYDMKDDIYSSNTDKTVTIGNDYSTTLTSSSSFKIMVKHNGKEDTYSAKDDGSGKYSYYLKISPVEGDISITAYH